MASRRTRSMRPSFISAASTLRPVGLMRSPMITKGRSIETTTSRVRELRTVSTNESAFAEGLVDQLDGLLQRLGALRAFHARADALLGHACCHHSGGITTGET